ncbi:hypothetical protein ACXHPE_11690 [Vibrio cincinnatiensis]|uniref:Uncharacterized protein n=1 Tax=Vibrio rhizosphaerae TaxID=398736 RepID=A0ABU4IYD1_9VIBR|nr:hypothetical protein [Vibrio rhizosphaerae]MDW6094410.1 hypothetical protein [Vibrio rhizosphaerae]
MHNKTDQEKSDYIRQCFEDGEKDYVNGYCIDGKEFLDSLDRQIELEEDEEDRKLVVERENSPTIKMKLDEL